MYGNTGNMHRGCMIGICSHLLRRLPVRPFWSPLRSPAERSGRCFFSVCHLLLLSGCQQLASMLHVDHCETEGKQSRCPCGAIKESLQLVYFLSLQKNQERQKRGRRLQWKPLIFLPITWMVTSCAHASIIKLFPSLTLPNPFCIPVNWGILSVQGFQMTWPTQLEQA